MWPDLTLGPSFKVKRGKPNLKMLVTRLLLVLVNIWCCLQQQLFHERQGILFFCRTTYKYRCILP